VLEDIAINEAEKRTGMLFVVLCRACIHKQSLTHSLDELHEWGKMFHLRSLFTLMNMDE
jgi:hypothetical protein